MSAVLQFSERIFALPVIHGSGDCAIEVRRRMLEQPWDCLAVPLPPSFQPAVEAAIDHLPRLALVVQEEPRWSPAKDWTPESSADDQDDESDDPTASYVPIDPCQPVIAALRIAVAERLPRAFVDLETTRFESYSAVYPDPYALKQVAVDQFSAAVLPSLPRLPEGQPQQRAAHMAAELHRLEQRYKKVLFVCSLMEWPWIREAYQAQQQLEATAEPVDEPQTYGVQPETALFMLGELPFITGMYEQARADLDADENLSVDGVKGLVLTARTRYQKELGRRARRLSPKLLQSYFQYVRNLSLIEHRLTPDFYTLLVAARQIGGDAFALALAETAREYPFPPETTLPTIACGVHRGRLPDGTMLQLKNRLPGQLVQWRTMRLQPQPPKLEQQQWEMNWNPHRQCSWPPEDIAIEKFRTHVKDTALGLLGNDLARTEKFSTSLKDGLDLRETLRQWHTGSLYVKELPPARGKLDCVVMLFDSPADPREYPWRVTWHAEHHDESTLALFATNFQANMIGPGIGQALYGGSVFLFPPRSIPDIWRNPRFDFTDTLEERLLAAACYHARERHIALLSAAPPGLGWKQLAKRFGKKLVHVPIGRFSQELIQRLRVFHVLNGTQIRNFAAHFIREA